MSLHSVPKILLASLAACAIAAAALPAHAVGTRQFVLDTLESLQGGDLTGTSVSSDGTVRAGWTLGATPVPDATSVWSSLLLPDGSVLLGTGSDGKIYRVAGGKVTVAVETGEMGVSAMALAWDGQVVAGTFPGGKLFRFAPNIPEGSKPQAWVTLPETEDVWAVVYDAKNKALFAATGAEGKLFRVDRNGKAEVYFDSDEAHLVSLALAPDGTLLAGSNGKALLYQLSGPGRTSVLYDFDGDDVKAIATATVGRERFVYAIANTYSGGQKGLPPPRPTGASGAQPQSNRPVQAGKGTLIRIDGRGAAEKMMNHDDLHYVSLVVDDAGAPFVGTGSEGRVYTVDDNHVVSLVADTEERQIGAMLVQGNRRFAATSDPVVLHDIKGVGGPDSIWTSKVLDAGLRAQFGLLEWSVTGVVELQTRSGNTEKPDKSWSDWSKALTAPGKVTSPAARYLQVRGRWTTDAKAVLSRVKLSFVTDNARALLTSVTVGESETESGGNKIPESGSPLDAPSTSVKIKWKVENPDNDKLRYRVLYRRLDDPVWRTVTDPNESLTKTDYAWETLGVPEGRYVVRVDSSDELSNPPDRMTRHSLESRPFPVDGTPPSFTVLRLAGTRLQGTATDGVGPIARLEFTIVGSKIWYPVFPTDGIFDQATESFDVDVKALVPPGPQQLAVRAYDKVGNSVLRSVTATGVTVAAPAPSP